MKLLFYIWFYRAKPRRAAPMSRETGRVVTRESGGWTIHCKVILMRTEVCLTVSLCHLNDREMCSIALWSGAASEAGYEYP